MVSKTDRDVLARVDRVLALSSKLKEAISAGDMTKVKETEQEMKAAHIQMHSRNFKFQPGDVVEIKIGNPGEGFRFTVSKVDDHTKVWSSFGPEYNINQVYEVYGHSYGPRWDIELWLVKRIETDDAK